MKKNGFKGISVLLKDDNLRSLHGWKKVQHILAYYKFLMLVICIIIYFIGYNIYGHLTHKDVILYTALVNVVAGDDLTGHLEGDFLGYLGVDASKNTMKLYANLYLTDDELSAYHEYTYASRMKILAILEGKSLDVILMNQEAFDAFSQNGYLYDLEQLLSEMDPALYEQVKSDFAYSIVILEDNSNDLILDNSIPYSALTEEHPFGLDISQTPFIRQSGFEENIYLGIAANSPRLETVFEYLKYLYSGASAGGVS